MRLLRAKQLRWNSTTGTVASTLRTPFTKPSCPVSSHSSCEHTPSETHTSAVLSSFQIASKDEHISEKDTTEAAKPFEAIPGPFQFPFVGNFPQMVANGLQRDRYQVSVDMYKKYGPIYKMTIGNYHIVYVHEPRDYEKVFRAEGRNPLASVLYLWPFHEYNKQRGYGDSNLLGLKGEEWRKIRIPMQEQIFSVTASQAYADLLVPIVEDSVKLVDSFRGKLDQLMPRVTFEMIGAVLFNKRLGSLQSIAQNEKQAASERFINSVLSLMASSERMINIPIASIARFLYWDKFKEAMDIMYEEGDKYIALVEDELTKDPQSDEFKRASLSYVGKNLLSSTLTAEQLRSNIITFLFAGVDTTASSIRWLLVNLAQNPEIQEKLYEEFATHLKGRTITSKDLESMEFPYFRATLKESFRLTPTTGGVLRWLEKDIVIQGYNIKQGAAITYAPAPILRDESRLENARTFVPERWLAGVQAAKTKEDGLNTTFAHVQFGFGPRQCLGAKLANIEIMMFFSRLMQDYRIELDPPTQTWGVSSAMTTVPDPMPTLKFIRRNL
jgi:cytochrome P450